MALDSTEIVVGANGSIHVAPFGTTAPTSEAASYGTGWVELGYVTDDGVKFTDSKEVSDVNGWQSFYALRKIVTGRDATVEFTLLQWNLNTIPLAFGGGTITQPTSGHFKYTPPDPSELDERAVGIDWSDGDKDYRLIIPKVFVSDAVETTIARTDASVLPIKLGLIGTGGDPYYLYSNDMNWSA